MNDFTFREGTRPVKGGSIKSLEVLYKDEVLALFTEGNTKGDLQTAADAYVETYGYLAEWRYQCFLQGKIISWDDSMKVNTSATLPDGVTENPEGFGKLDLITPSGQRRPAKVVRCEPQGEGMKIVIEQQMSEAYEPQISRLLELLDHPEALVTDGSQFLDFICQFEYPTMAAAHQRLVELLLEENLHVPITPDMTLVEAAKAIAEFHPNWPKLNLHH